MATRSFAVLFAVTVVFAVSGSVAQTSAAKRAAPPVVAPVVVGGIQYRADAKPGVMGFVEAHETKSGALLWSRQIYVIVRNPRLEGDVQDVYITKLKEDGNALLIYNERNDEYRLDLKTLEIYPLKGSIRVEFKP